MQSVMCLSSKGGVGKTLVAINLAIELARRGYRVALVDLDIDSSNIGGLLDLNPDVDIDMSHRKMVPQDYNGMKVFAMSIFLPRANMGVTIPDSQRRQFIIDAIKNTAWGELDFMIFDMPGGTAVEFMTLRSMIPDCKTVIVTQPNTLEDCNRTVDLCDHFKVPIMGIVENMSGSLMHGMPVMCTCGCGQEFAPFGMNTVRDEFPGIPFLGRIQLSMDIFTSKPPRIPEQCDVVQNIISALGVN